MKTFLSYLKPYRRQAVLAVLCIEAEAAFELVIPLVMAQDVYKRQILVLCFF